MGEKVLKEKIKKEYQLTIENYIITMYTSERLEDLTNLPFFDFNFLEDMERILRKLVFNAEKKEIILRKIDDLKLNKFNSPNSKFFEILQELFINSDSFFYEMKSSEWKQEFQDLIHSHIESGRKKKVTQLKKDKTRFIN